ncbi:MAG: hypothetical protein ACRDXB_21390, partial [Actinomycetes bacterium]
VYNGHNFNLNRGTATKAATRQPLVGNCDLADLKPGVWTTRFEECTAWALTWAVTANGTFMGNVDALVVNERKLNHDSGNFTERLNVLDVRFPKSGILSFTLNTPKIDCKPGNCRIENIGGWQGVATWIPGGPSHSAATDVSYSWKPDSPSTPQVMKLGRQVSMASTIKIAGTGEDGFSLPARFRDLRGEFYNADPTEDGNSDQIRCDNTKVVKKVTTIGCVFHNYVPTYTFDAAKYPQASSHAWLIQQKLSNHPGSKADTKPLYFLPGAGNSNRRVICPDGWAAANGDTRVLNGPTDKRLNCDEFAFNATYNSGGMPSSKGGLNPVSSGNACVQTFATKPGDT